MLNYKSFSFGMLVMPLAILGVGIAIAGSVTTPNTFSAGTPAVAAEVNQNFAAHEAAINDNDSRLTTTQASLPVVWSQMDADSGGTSVSASGHKEINSINVTIPVAGLLVITGNVFINNNDVANTYTVEPKLNGSNIAASGWAAAFDASANATGVAENFTLSYTITTQVAAGNHTVSQTVGPFSGTSDFFHNSERLVVQFIPISFETTQDSP